MSAPASALRVAACEALGYAPEAGPSGNVTLGRGAIEGRPVRMALVENRIASGSLGRREVDVLAPALEASAKDRMPFVLFLDSAGARISEGLDALGAFRLVFRQALALGASGTPYVTVVGRNCFGGASMLAHTASRRLFSPNTLLAMSGPSILASAAGASALDEAFRAMADAALGTPARAKVNEANTAWTPALDLRAWFGRALVPVEKPWGAWHARHVALRSRLEKPPASPGGAPLRRKDLDRLYPEGYELSEADGVLEGSVQRDGQAVRVVGLVGTLPLGTARAWRFAESAWHLAREAPARVEVLLDCETHAARLEDERAILTEYIVDMGAALSAAGARGTRVELTVLDRAGGGVYVALAAPAQRVRAVYGADIQVLPGSAVASILGSHTEAVGDILDYRKAGVADEQVKLGLPP